MVKPKIVFFIDWYEPAYLAGGPIKSIKQLALGQADTYENHIITGDRDLLDHPGMESVHGGLILVRKEAVVHYFTRELSLVNGVINKLRELRPEIVYINGLYSLYFSIVPSLLLALGVYKPRRVIIAPRGMLQKGALAQKGWKKRIYLFLFKYFIRRKDWWYQATDDIEKDDIMNRLGVKQDRIQVLGNIPGHPKESIDQIELEIPIRLVLISRLSPKKNIGGLIRQLMEVKAHVVVNVYGPFDDGRYKNEVYRLVDSLPSNVSLFFNKPIHPDEVDRVISKAHFFILLTHGENFGHSIFEALAVGRPVIISRHTPWTETVEKGAGYLWDSSNTLQDIIENISSLSQEEYESQCKTAYEAAKRYYQEVTSNSIYKELFSLNS